MSTLSIIHVHVPTYSVSDIIFILLYTCACSNNVVVFYEKGLCINLHDPTIYVYM